MRTIWLLPLVLLLLIGCSGGVRSHLLEMDLHVASPVLRLNSDVPVVYPYPAGGASRDPMVGSFGPSWESLEPVAGEYRFNP